MLFSLLVFFLLPFINTSLIKDTTFRPLFKFFYFLAIVDFFILLGWLSQSPVTDSYILAGQIATAYYFLFFLILIPLIGRIETFLIHYNKKYEKK